MELDDIKKDAEAYLQKQKEHFGVKVVYFGSDKKRYQIEIPDAQTKKVGIGYELQSQRKGYKRYHTNETKVFIFSNGIIYVRGSDRKKKRDV